MLLGLISAILFGASTPASKLLLAELAPFQLAGLLYLGAVLGMTPVVIFGSRHTLSSPLNRSNRIRLGGAIVLGGMLGPLLLLMGLRLTTAGSVSLILNLEMAVTAVLGVVLFREHLSRLGWLGIIGLVGTGILVSFEGGRQGLSLACWSALRVSVGDLITI